MPLNASTVKHSGGIIGTSSTSPTKLYQSFQVTQFLPFLLSPPQRAFSLIQKLFIHCTLSSSVPSFYQSFCRIFTFFRLLIKWKLSLSSDAAFFPLKLLGPLLSPSATFPFLHLVFLCFSLSLFLLNSSPLFRLTCRRMDCVNSAKKNTSLHFKKKHESFLLSLWVLCPFSVNTVKLSQCKRGWNLKNMPKNIHRSPHGLYFCIWNNS